MGMGGQRHALAALPPGKGPATYWIGGWVVARACRPPRRFDPPTAQLIASRYTDWTILAHAPKCALQKGSSQNLA
jgi:hypothetical protein